MPRNTLKLSGKVWEFFLPQNVFLVVLTYLLTYLNKMQLETVDFVPGAALTLRVSK